MPKATPRHDQTTAPAWPEVLDKARKCFGIDRFRPGQREVLESVFAGKDTLALMPTGAGKSLTYQLPAMFLPRPVLVVSPLISLMQDQQDKAEHAHIVVEKLDSTQTRAQTEHANSDIHDHTAQLIYVTPERLENQVFLHSLKEAGGISLLVIDEAHCIAQWGHDFRPAFLNIGQARKKLGNPPVLALTATATTEVVQEILSSLHAPDATIINNGTERQNLSFAVFPAVNQQSKLQRITEMIAAEDHDATGIIYTASVRTANDLFDYLTEHGISTGHYHGKLPTRQREQAQADFMAGKYKVMIATKAFGLGIDKPDIRFVYHFEFPDSLETYYQEAGRAGRDGKPAHAALLYRLEDKRIQSFFLAGRYPHLSELQAVYNSISGRVLTVASTLVEASPAELRQSLAEAASGSSAGCEDPAPARIASLPAEAPVAEPAAPEQPLQGPAGSRPLVTALTIAAESGVGRRRTQVILNLLREAGMIQLGRRGYRLKTTHLPSDKAFEELLHTFTDRAHHDSNRLADMMHYAETTGCRTQVIRTYFSEPAGEPCQRCDNCAKAAAESVTRLAPHLKARQPVAATQAPATPHQQQVATVNTPIGSYQTTRLPAPAAAAEPVFQPGDPVTHSKFGLGKVVQVEDRTVLVQFGKGGKRRLRADFLSAA